ncbi:XRE family transcriptional regulator [Leptotrichia sp. OH3620_COT-345]|uniref:helix-turn-helix domain-containing protein n=1 Tax=Leptotrichia sp. OH3620_COT-345 TaxID=2491048 RepID=UPI000F6507B4|nr:helix-turn-helix transcriptional regulator [Leptotrichia sp. OH3620_COT-345]RRD39504.1 XRE family transcriptional regulator [Leptotrichia sp. OH3620_COT-345]
MKKTGEILEEYLKKKMTQTDLAKIIEVSPQYINNIIKNLKSPSENFLEKFYKIFDVNEKDKIKISEYEEFRKLPKKFQEEILLLKKSGERESEDDEINNMEKISILGKFDSGGLFRYSENSEYLFFPKHDTNNELFGIRIQCIHYIPDFYINDILIFEKNNDYRLNDLHGKIALIEYKEKIEVKKIEYMDEIIVVKSLGNNDNMMLLTKDKHSLLKVRGTLKSCFRIF